MMLTAYLFYSFFGYLSGSVLYSYLIPKYFCHVDVRTVNEDQNPGAFNAFSVAGPRIGLLCVLCDIGKGFLPVFLAAHSSAVSMSSWIFALILLAPVAGHAWPFRKGDLCLVRRAARPPAGSAAGASSCSVLSDAKPRSPQSPPPPERAGRRSPAAPEKMRGRQQPAPQHPKP